MSDNGTHDEPTRVDTPVDDPTMAMPAVAGAPPVDEPPPPTDEPPPPRDWRPWIIAAIVALIALVGLALLLADDDDDDSATTTTTESTTTTEPSTTTTTQPTTTTSASTTTTAAPPPTVDPALCVSSGPDEPEPVAEVVYEAFTLGDRSCAGNLATPAAVDQLFAIPGAGGGWTFEGCTEQDVPDPHTLCSYRFEGGSTGFRMNYSETDGWTVYEVFQVAD